MYNSANLSHEMCLVCNVKMVRNIEIRLVTITIRIDRWHLVNNSKVALMRINRLRKKKNIPGSTVSTMSDFKNWSDLVLRQNFGLRPNLQKKLKWQQASGLKTKTFVLTPVSEYKLGLNFRWTSSKIRSYLVIFRSDNRFGLRAQSDLFFQVTQYHPQITPKT